nr:CTL3 [Takifugu obscurus]|eukprot:XP_011609304.1 PREDICTED: C-type lectin domain family 4 member M-like [Takifugu rubripes]
MEIDVSVYQRKNLKMEGLIPKDLKELQAKFNRLKTKHRQLSDAKTQLQSSYSSLEKRFTSLLTEKDQLQSNYQNLQTQSDQSKRELQQLQGNFSSLQAEKDQLQRNYGALSNGKSQLQSNFDALNREKQTLKSNLDSLRTEKNQLHSNFDALNRAKTEVQRRYDDAVKVRYQLQKKIDQVRKKIVCENGWKKFDFSCYYVSTTTKSWKQSREFCTSRGGDLLIVNSGEEQAFVNTLLKTDQNAWMGLSDTVTEGNWTWVDGTRATTTYWQPGQPNSYGGNQDCGELLHDLSGAGQWNDDACTAEQTWVCEK